MLKSEVEDLRILIQSADRDVESLKRLRNNDAIEAGRRYASLESKVLTVSIFFFIIYRSIYSHLGNTLYQRFKVSTYF